MNQKLYSLCLSSFHKPHVPETRVDSPYKMSTATAEAQAATLAKFIEGWKEFTAESWTETWTDDCTQNFLPFTMGVPPRTKPEVLKLLPSLLGVLHNYKVPEIPSLSSLDLRRDWS